MKEQHIPSPPKKPLFSNWQAMQTWTGFPSCHLLGITPIPRTSAMADGNANFVRYFLLNSFFLNTADLKGRRFEKSHESQLRMKSGFGDWGEPQQAAKVSRYIPRHCLRKCIRCTPMPCLRLCIRWIPMHCLRLLKTVKFQSSFSICSARQPFRLNPKIGRITTYPKYPIAPPSVFVIRSVTSNDLSPLTIG